jgi:hypothetical protein
LKYVGSDPTKNGHALQEFDPPFLHGDSPESLSLIRGGSVGKEERPLALRGSPLRKSCGCQRTRFIAPSINGNDNMSRSTALIRANF